MAKVLTDNANYTAIANAIRSKGGSGTFKPSEMASAILSIQSGIDVSDATAVAANITNGKTAYVSTGKVTGSYIPYLEFTNKTVSTSAWSSDTTYSVFPYKASVSCSGATNAMFPYVEFSEYDSQDGMFFEEAESYNGGVYIYAQEIPESIVTISKITFYKRT